MQALPAAVFAGAPLRGHFHVVYRRLRFRNWLAYFTHRLKVFRQRLLKIAPRLILRIANRDTAKDIR